MKFEEEHQAILRDLEAGIIQIYEKNPEMTDHNADKAMDLLTRSFEADIKGKRQPNVKLNTIEKLLYQRLLNTCEFWMSQREPGLPVYTKETVILCLKRIHKSMHSWTRQNGMRGYLDFVKAFING